jgi:hypothetical protein
MGVIGLLCVSLDSSTVQLHDSLGSTMMDILSEHRKKEYPKSVTELLRLGGKRCVQGVPHFIKKSYIYLKIKIRFVRKEKEADVQNMNSILSDLS